MTDAAPQRLFESFVRLKSAAPAQFRQAVSDFATYTDEAMRATAFAPLDEVTQQQGRAQQCVAILRMLTDCLNAS